LAVLSNYVEIQKRINYRRFPGREGKVDAIAAAKKCN